MVQCLITKLKGVVNNEALPKLDELIIEVSNAKNGVFKIYGDVFSNISIRTFGEVIIKDTDTSTKSINGSGKIFLSGENNITGIASWKDKSFNYPNLRCSFLGKCSTLNISNELYSTPLDKGAVELKVSNSNLVGNFTSQEVIEVTNCTYNGGAFNLSNIPSNRLLSSVSLLNSKVKGDISYFNANDFPNLTLLETWGNSMPEQIYGDISKIMPLGGFISLSLTKNPLSWTERTSGKIIAMSLINLGANVDKMLVDQSSLEVGSKYKYKTISVTGTRTNASDTAIQTLQSKGFTVSITPSE